MSPSMRDIEWLMRLGNPRIHVPRWSGKQQYYQMLALVREQRRWPSADAATWAAWTGEP